MALSNKAIFIRGSSNGRTTGSGPVYRGSNPCPRASEKKRLLALF